MIPFEILDKIIDQVYMNDLQDSIEYDWLQKELFDCEHLEDPFYHRYLKSGSSISWDTTTLKVCCLVCKEWVPRCRFHLFSKLTAVCAKNFRRRLSVFSTVAPDLRHLDLEEMDSWDADTADIPLPWLNHIMPHLTVFRHLESLTLTEGYFSDDLYHFFNSFPSLQHLSLTHCYFDSSDQIIHALSACPNLESLSLRIQSHDDPVSVVPFCSPRKVFPRLRSLLLCASDVHTGVLNWLLGSVDVASIEILRVNSSRNEHMPIIARVLRLLGPSLTHLHLGVISNPKPAYTFSCHVDLSANTQLRTFRVQHIVLFSIGDLSPAETACYAHGLISQIASPHIEEIILSTTAANLEELDSFNFAEMERILQRPNFKGLRRVWFQSLGAVDHVLSRNLLRQRLPECDARGILVFN